MLSRTMTGTVIKRNKDEKLQQIGHTFWHVISVLSYRRGGELSLLIYMSDCQMCVQQIS